MLDRIAARFVTKMYQADREVVREGDLGNRFNVMVRGRVVLDPDEQVQQIVRLVFAQFEQCGSALGVVQYFRRRQLLFPTRGWGGNREGALLWSPLTHGRLLAVLHNPAYAGAYVYGRTHTRTACSPEEAPRVKGRTRRLVQEDWTVLLPEAHPGYLSRDEFLRNQERLADNCTHSAAEHRGAVRTGAALLQGMVSCGRCGRRMSVRYHETGTVPTYECNQLHKALGAPACQSVRGDTVDAAVAELLLAAMQPAQLEVSLATLDQLEIQAQQVEQQGQLRLERARYEAELARRRFCAVEPENRLVARSLERDWNEKLEAIERLEQEQARRPRATAQLAGPAERQRILALAQDLPAIWKAATTTQSERKQLIRFLIKDVTLSKTEETIQVGVRWQTEAVTSLELPRLRRVWEQCRTTPEVIARIRELAETHPDRQVADRLNAEGWRSGRGGPFTAKKVQWVRYAHGLPTFCPEAPKLDPAGGPQRGDGRCSARSAAAALNVDVSTIAEWCKSGRLDGIQAVPHGPRWIRLTPTAVAELRKSSRRRWSRAPRD